MNKKKITPAQPGMYMCFVDGKAVCFQKYSYNNDLLTISYETLHRHGLIEFETLDDVKERIRCIGFTHLKNVESLEDLFPRTRKKVRWFCSYSYMNPNHGLCYENCDFTTFDDQLSNDDIDDLREVIARRLGILKHNIVFGNFIKLAG